MRHALLALAVMLLAGSGCLDDFRMDRDLEEQPHDLIRADEYLRWIIEIDFVEGHEPARETTETLRQRMLSLVYKPHIEIRIDDALPGQETWSQAAIDALHDETQDWQTGGDTIVTHVLYLDGAYEDPDVLGLATGHDHVALFKERIVDGCQPFYPSDPMRAPCIGLEGRIETAVLVHEFGHILGLVNRGVPMVNDHEGAGEKGRFHSRNPDSVMYHAVASAGVFALSEIPTDFDRDDRLDICAYGGKGVC